MERTRTILIVDDTEMFRELGSLFLSRIGRVVTAASGEEGLVLAKQHRPDVVLLDLMMADLDGAELCRRMRTQPRLRHVPIVVVTASARAEDHERAIRAGADQVMSKPISRVALIDAVNRYLHSPAARGMPRVRLDTPVRILHPDAECWGEAINVSSGGMFVASSCSATPSEEVSLEFSLPELPSRLTPTAEVVWRRDPAPGASPGLGLRFMRLDGSSARELINYVHERYASF